MQRILFDQPDGPPPPPTCSTRQAWSRPLPDRRRQFVVPEGGDAPVLKSIPFDRKDGQASIDPASLSLGTSADAAAS